MKIFSYIKPETIGRALLYCFIIYKVYTEAGIFTALCLMLISITCEAIYTWIRQCTALIKQLNETLNSHIEEVNNIANKDEES